nr:hypothetical protein [uncultured Flavobacterium sp.]
MKNNRFGIAVTLDIHGSNDLKALKIKSYFRYDRTNYLQVKQDIQEMQSEMERLLNDPALAYLVLKK